MKRTKSNLLLLVFSLAVTFAFYNFTTAGAQTGTPNSRERQIQTAPTPSPTVQPMPRVTPTPEVEEVIKIDTELVNLNVRVVDRSNRSIGSLRQEDFKIYEDNVLQPIEFFTTADVPTNYSLVIDNSNSLRPLLEQVIESSKIIINSNRADDETSIIRFVSSQKIVIEQDFTNDKAELLETLDNLYTEGGQTAIIDAVYLAAEKVIEYENSIDPNDRKRRALILISDGEDRSSHYKEQQLFDLLKETDVQIFVIGFINELSKEGGFVRQSPQAKAKSLLERMASATGGKVYFPNSLGELNGIAADIARELRTQYSIGYVPTNDRRDGSVRNIKVSVSDGPNKQKRIALTRTARKATADSGSPVLQK